MISLKHQIRVKPSVVFTELDNGEGILVNFETKYYYGLNEMAAKIWQLVDKKNNITDIVDKIVNEYDVDKEKALKSVNKQIEMLIKEKMIEFN